MTLALTSRAEGSESRETRAVAMRLVGSSATAAVEGENALPSRSNYFIGSDPEKWRRDIPHFERVRVKNAWPGIDAIYYSTAEREYEFDFVVAPKANPEAIELAFEGAEHIGIDSHGGLGISLGGRILQWRKPVAYQMIGGKRVDVAANYFRPVDSPDRIKISLGSYDRNEELVIDPVIVYSTFLGGQNSEWARGIAVNAAGEAYVVGNTFSVDFPTLNPLPGGAAYKNSEEVFVAKLNAAGTALIFSTYLGGHSGEYPNDVKLDASGNIYVVGLTYSRDFPTTPGAKQTQFAGNQDGFALKLGPAGNILIYSTYFGGMNFDEAHAVAVDPAGSAYVVGEVNESQAFVTNAGGFQMQHGGGADGFVVKLHPVSGAAVYESFWGTGSYDILRRVAVNASGEAFLGGVTCSGPGNALSTTNSPPVFRPVKSGSCEAVITKVAADGASRIWATYLGSSGGYTDVWGLDLDAAGNVYVAGRTDSPTLPSTAGSPQPARTTGTGQVEGYVAKLSPTGTELVYLTYLGGNSWDEVHRLIVVNNRATIVGSTSSANFPLVNPLMSQYHGFPANTAFSSDGGTTWTPPTTIAPNMTDARWMQGIGVDPTNPSVLYAGRGCCHIHKSVNGGVTWTSHPVTGVFEIRMFTVAPSSPSTVYGATVQGVLKSTDGGSTWTVLSSGFSNPTPNINWVAVSPTNPNLLYAGVAFNTNAPFYRSDNGGVTWSPANVGITGNLDVRKILFDPSTPTRLWAATSSGIYIGSTVTNSWSRGTNLLTEGIEDIAVDSTGAHLYAVNWANIWKSTNSGVNWSLRTSYELKDFTTAIAVDPANGNTVYVASWNRGIRKSTDGGLTFGNPSIPTVHVSMRSMVVGTDGRVHIAIDNGPEGFLTQVNETGTAFTFSTYLGRTGWDIAYAAAADSSGNLYVALETGTPFPTTVGAVRRFDPSPTAGVVKISTATPACSLTAAIVRSVFGWWEGATDVNVVAPSGCGWDASTAADWIVLHKTPGNTLGPGGFGVTLRNNTAGAPRTGTINVSGPAGSTSVSITQGDSGGTCQFIQSASNSNLYMNGGTGTFHLLTFPGCPWALVESPPWLTVSPTSGTGSATITITAAANPNPGSRSFSLNFGPFSHSVNQNGVCAYLLSPSNFAVGPAGGTQDIAVLAPTGCAWGISGLPNWIRANQASGTGPGTIRVTVLPNISASARSANIQTPFRAAFVTQSGATCTYGLSSFSAPTQTRFGAVVGVNVVTAPGCAWHARSNGSWVRLDGAEGDFGRTGTGPTTLNMLVLGNPERFFRSTSVTIAGMSYNVPQEAGSPVLAHSALVQNLYWDLLGRPPEAGGLTYWVDQVRTGASTRSQVAAAYFNAPEFGDSAQFVINVYLGLLGRDPDFAGWVHWLGLLRSGQTRLAVVSSVLAAPELAAIYNPMTLEQFVGAIYLNLLGRSAAPSEIAFWVGSGQTRPQIALQFLESAEFRDRFRRRALANACYLGFLRRSAEPDGRAFWEDFQLTGTLDEMVGAFINSDEYLNRPFSAR